jgi:hypothetical protein
VVGPGQAAYRLAHIKMDGDKHILIVTGPVPLLIDTSAIALPNLQFSSVVLIAINDILNMPEEGQSPVFDRHARRT